LDISRVILNNSSNLFSDGELEIMKPTYLSLPKVVEITSEKPRKERFRIRKDEISLNKDSLRINST